MSKERNFLSGYDTKTFRFSFIRIIMIVIVCDRHHPRALHYNEARLVEA